MTPRRPASPALQIAAWFAFVFCVLPVAAMAQAADEPTQEPAAAEESPGASTVGDPTIPIGQLDLLLDPLTRSELEVEAGAWRDLVKAKVSAISAEEIATRKKNEEIAEVDAEAEAVAEPAATDAVEEVKKEEKQAFLDDLTQLREEKSALLERLGVVLDAWEQKGGDPTEIRQYASAVSGIKVEVTDVSATWAAITGWLASKEGGLKWGMRVLQFLAIMLAFWIIASLVGKVVRKATSMHEGMSDLLKRFINRMVRRTILVIGLLVALSSLGVNIGALLALIGGGAFIIGFALQDTLGNFAAGIMLLIYRPFDVGDAVEVASVNGKVDSVSLVSTTIRTFDNKVVLVPNKQVWGQIITNATASDERRVDMVFGIGYDDDADKAKEILEKVVREHELVLEEPEPVIQLNELADSSVNFICRPWAKTPDFWTVHWDITRAVKKEFDAAGISIPYPQQDVHVHQVGPAGA